VSDEFLEIERMTAELEAGPAVHRPSVFWARLNARHARQLQASGFENFKRTVNMRYFNWRILGIVRHQLGVVASWARRPDLAVFGAQLPRPSSNAGTSGRLNPPSAWIYKTFVAMFADLVRAQDRLHLLDRLEEPALGNPFMVRYRGRNISQDLCNSIHEIYSIFGSDGGALRSGDGLEILEIGAGYGRLAYAVLAASPGAAYTIVDVPPALYISQRYLTAVLPDVPAFRYREWSDFATVRQEFEASRLRFLLPHQAAQLPAASIDVAVSISSLHEMSRQQVEHYFAFLARACRGHVYTKQWRRSRTPENDVVFGEHDYPVPAGWREDFHRRHPIQRMFFEARYDVAAERTERLVDR
jgi:putative sugar O-methyltransferase